MRALIFPSANVLQSLVEGAVSRYFGHGNAIELVHIGREEGARVKRSIESSGMSPPGVAGDTSTPLRSLHGLVDHARIHCAPDLIH